MNERYTYGYNNGFNPDTLKPENVAWNIENEYINSLNEIMEDYNNQVKKIGEINSSIANAEIDNSASIKEKIDEANNFIEKAQEEIARNNNVTYPTFSDDQIMRWYNEDYPSYNTTITFESYKANILRELEFSNNINKENLIKRNEELSKQILEKQEYLSKLKLENQEYLANFISQKKDESKANMRYMIDIKNESKKTILKKKNEINLLLSEKRIQLSSILLEQQRTTPKYDDNGNVLNSKELIALRNKYDSVWLEIRKIETALQKLDEMLVLMEYTQYEIDLMMRGLNPKQKEIYNNIIDAQIKMDVPEQNQNVEEVNNDTLEPVDVENKEPEEITQSDESKLTEEEIEELSNNIEEVMKENKDHEEVNDLSFEGIVKKVCGDSSFTKAQSSMYAASKIKVFNKPQLNNLGFMGKVTSISKSIIGIIPKAAMKLYGKLIDTETEEIFQDMETRAMNLSDAEVEALLNGYNDKLDMIPKGFEQIVKPRINSYVSKRVEYLQKSFNEAMYNIAASQKEIEEPQTDGTLSMAYFLGSSSIKDTIKLHIEVEKLLGASNLHSFDSQLKSLDNKLVYAGARFERAKEYDTSLWSKVSGLSQKIEYSLDPIEVVTSYTERENIYKEYGKHKSYLTESDLERLNNSRIVVEKTEKEEKIEGPSTKTEEIRSLIEGLKAMKAELTEEEVKEIENLLR